MSFVKIIAGKKPGDIIDKAKLTLCVPIRISNINYNNINISNQKADSSLSNIKDLLPVIESAFKTTDSIIQGDALAKFEETIQLNLERRGFDINSGATCIYQLLNSVNIYLVTHTLCGDKTDDEKWVIPSDTVCSIKLDKKELHNKIENKEFEKANERGEVEAVLLGCYKRDTERYFAGAGSNSTNGSVISSFADVREHCSIFLWIDHIYETSNKYKDNNISFEALLTFVLLHELMHLMMDVFDEKEFGIDGEGNFKDLGQLYGYFREESLANALALHLCDSKGNEALAYSILEHFVQNQTIPYQTGLLYKDLFEKAVKNWMKCKTGKYLTKQLAKEWLLEITEEKSDPNNLRRIEDEIEEILRDK
ncbi:MAG: hypothetical protein SO001_07935 [Alloprevotella sp.]|nr:hypothetical protein [Alloprevotella sp.]